MRRCSQPSHPETSSGSLSYISLAATSPKWARIGANFGEVALSLSQHCCSFYYTVVVMDIDPRLPEPTSAEIFLQFSRTKLVDQFWPRLQSAVEPLADEQIWWRPNPASNSIGNLLLHLNGNVWQWLVASFNRLEDARNRPAEFNAPEQFLKGHAVGPAGRHDAGSGKSSFPTNGNRPADLV